MRARMRFYLFLFSILVFSISAHAETIILRDGQTIKGKVLGHDSEFVTINTDGITKVIPKSKVYKVIFGSGSSELQRFLTEKDKKKTKYFKSKEEGDEEDINLAQIDAELNEDRAEIGTTINQLEDKIDKLQKKISKLRAKLTKLKQKGKSPKSKKQASLE
jgi:chromosome segregation ATPase